MKFNQLFIVSAMSLLVLAGCSSSDANKTASETATTAPSESTTKQTTPEKTAGGYTALQSVVAKTQAAANAGDFAKAKAEFAKFEASWAKVEDGVKSKSKEGYKNIEETVDTVNSSLKASKPDAAKVSAALAALKKNITSLPK